MSLLELKEEISKKDKYIKEFAAFLDKKNNPHLVSIRVVPDIAIALESFNENKQETGYMNLFFHPNRRIYLDTIYCYNQYRSLEIASKLSEVADYVLRDYDGYIIRGAYEPSQMSTDRENKISCSQEELNKRADNFYGASGYSKIYYDDYIKNPSMYPDINETDDFKLGEELVKCIVVKKVIPQEQEHFRKIKGILINAETVEHMQNMLTQDIEQER